MYNRGNPCKWRLFTKKIWVRSIVFQFTHLYFFLLMEFITMVWKIIFNQVSRDKLTKYLIYAWVFRWLYQKINFEVQHHKISPSSSSMGKWYNISHLRVSLITNTLTLKQLVSWRPTTSCLYHGSDLSMQYQWIKRAQTNFVSYGT